ncbi:hypothetical protein GCM10018965_009890 [Nonomuraea roseola]
MNALAGTGAIHLHAVAIGPLSGKRLKPSCTSCNRELSESLSAAGVTILVLPEGPSGMALMGSAGGFPGDSRDSRRATSWPQLPLLVTPEGRASVASVTISAGSFR